MPTAEQHRRHIDSGASPSSVGGDGQGYRPLTAEVHQVQRQVQALHARLLTAVKDVCAATDIAERLQAVEASSQLLRNPPSGSDAARRPSTNVGGVGRSGGLLARRAQASGARSSKRLARMPHALRDIAAAVRIVCDDDHADRHDHGSAPPSPRVPTAVRHALQRVEAAIAVSVRNSFDVVISSLQLQRFIGQWPQDRVFCYRCGSGPFTLGPSSGGSTTPGRLSGSGPEDDGDDQPVACAVCSTTLVPPDAGMRDFRVVRDFEAQVARRRAAVLEMKVTAFEALRDALRGGPLANARAGILQSSGADRVDAEAPPPPPGTAVVGRGAGDRLHPAQTSSVPGRPATTPSQLGPLADPRPRRGRSVETRPARLAAGGTTRTPSVPTPSRLPSRLPALSMSGQRSVLHDVQSK